MSWVTKMIVFADLAVQPAQLRLQAEARDRVERAERLVHQQHGRVGGERAGEADALALPAGELCGVARRVVRFEPDELEQLARRVARTSPCGQPSRRGTVAMFSPIVMCGKSPTCWIT